jgi:hypothetical protein
MGVCLIGGGGSQVYVTGNSYKANGVEGNNVTLQSAEILAHEIVDHAFPHSLS